MLFSVDFSTDECDTSRTVSVVVSAPDALAALQQVQRLFAKYAREFPIGHVHEIDYLQLRWEDANKALVSFKNRAIIVKGFVN